MNTIGLGFRSRVRIWENDTLLVDDTNAFHIENMIRAIGRAFAGSSASAGKIAEMRIGIGGHVAGMPKATNTVDGTSRNIYDEVWRSSAGEPLSITFDPVSMKVTVTTVIPATTHFIPSGSSLENDIGGKNHKCDELGLFFADGNGELQNIGTHFIFAEIAKADGYVAGEVTNSRSLTIKYEITLSGTDNT